MFRFIFRAWALCFIGLSITGLPSAHATSNLYKRECNGCHSGPPTCNGCHAHGVHETTGDNAALNLSATTDKSEYAAGDDIAITLSGGNQSQAADDWVGIKVYDDKGVELAHLKTALPAKLTTRAYDGMSKLYVSWIGHEYDGAGAKYGAPIGATFGAGMRESFLAGQHLQERHIEEIVATNEFTVRVAPALSPDSSANVADSDSNSGGGSVDPAWTLAAALFAALRRRKHNHVTS